MMAVTLNPVEEAILESCPLWLTREELVLELAPLTDPETVERTIAFLQRRRLLEGLATSSRASGQTTYHTTELGRRTLRIHHRRLADCHAIVRRLRLV